MDAIPTELLDGIVEEAHRTLAEMRKTTDTETRRLQSETVNNLCGSLGVFFDLMSNTMFPDMPDEFDSEEDDD